LEDERINLKLQIRELVKCSGRRGYTLVDCFIAHLLLAWKLNSFV